MRGSPRAAGKAILAWANPRQVQATFRGRLVSRTPRTLATVEALQQELAKVRARDRLAYSREESSPGVTCVAACLRGSSGAVAALSLTGEVARTCTGPLATGRAGPAGRGDRRRLRALG
ncbi:MAG: hypothetical protein NVS3B26_29570 [Mycobacteriales bacterium]